jgi:hypothetical protein
MGERNAVAGDDTEAEQRPRAADATLERLVVCTPVAPLHAEPKVSSPQTSQRLYGHTVEVLETRGDWRHVRGSDAYEGWVHAGYLRTQQPHDLQRERLRVSLGCRVRDGARAWQTRTLPLGALVPGDVAVLEGDALSRDELARRFPPHPEAIARTALECFAGTSYQWGGITPWGADCSGLVQSTFALHGFALPRDAWQQALVGQHAGNDLAALRAADLLFFSDRDDGRVTHVGISTGGARMVHLALGRGGFAVDRLDESSDPYVSALVKRFVGARRAV